MKKILLLIIFGLFFLKTPASAATLTACPNDGGTCSYVGGDGLQQAIDAAKDGDTIIMQAGNYRRSTFTPVEGEKYTQCFINTKRKNLTIRGEGKALIEGQNDELGTGTPGLFRVGICVQKGKVTIDNVWVQQTLSHALGISEGEVRVTNFYTVDIDSVPVVIRRGARVLIANSFINGPLFIDDDSYVRVINNTFYGGDIQGSVHLNFCRPTSPSALIINNIFSYTKAGIDAECIEQKEKLKNIAALNNLVWKYNSTGGVGDDSKPFGEPDCSANEICDFPNRIIGSPNFIAPAIYGDIGWAPWTDFHFKEEGSAAKGAGEGGADLGMYGNACTSSSSQACKALSDPFPTPKPTPTDSPDGPPGSTPIVLPGQKQGVVKFERNPTVLPPLFLEATPSAKINYGIDFFHYIFISAVYIMVIHFAVAISKEFNLFLMVGIFILTGAVGWYLKSYEMGFFAGMILSLLFW